MLQYRLWGTPPFGNSELVASNPPGNNELVQLDFQTTVLTSSPVGFLVPGTGTPLTPLANPGLVDLVGDFTAILEFTGRTTGPNQTSIDKPCSIGGRPTEHRGHS